MARALDVLVICLPVFAVIGLGKWLRARGHMTWDHHQFVNRLVYAVSLPCLIYTAVARQPMENFSHIGFYVGAMAPTLIVAGLYALIGFCMKLRGARLAGWISGTFWGNVAYIGIPIANRAFGPEGLEMAAVFNAVAMPLYLAMGILVVSLCVPQPKAGAGQILKAVFGNPILLSALFGFITVWLLDVTAVEDIAMMATLGKIAFATLELLGRMGLPLALIAIGGSLNVREIRSDAGFLVCVSFGKLVLLPWVSLMVMSVFYPGLPEIVSGSAVLLSGMPVSVAMYVIGTRMGLDEGFCAGLLMTSILGGAITIPIWVYCLS